MAVQKIRVMISSRCDDRIELASTTATLSDVRKALKKRIESEVLFNEVAFECWINEDAPSSAGDLDALATCLDQVRRADILLVLYNGHAGWAPAGANGICHEEFKTGLSTGAAKIRVVELPLTNARGPDHKRFQAYYAAQSRFRGAQASNGDEAIERSLKALRDAVVEMTRLGVREARKGKYDTGDALEWSRMGFAERKASIEAIVRASFADRGAKEDGKGLIFRIDSRDVLFLIHAVPDAMTVAPARELVGRPFLLDYREAQHFGGHGKPCGPVHIIACHKGVTPRQAADVLGFPDAVIVQSSFGVYIADEVQKIQLVFLRNCRDETETRHAVQRALDWLKQSGEQTLLVERAASRAAIVKAIEKEQRGAGARP